MPTKIEWTDESWNPVRGCSRVSEGCRNCYAEGVAARFSGAGMPYEGLITKTTKGPTWNGEIKLVPTKLGQPLRWPRSRMIFVNSMSDLFHPSVPDEFIDEVFAVMALAPQHTFQVLTKRPERMREYLSRPAAEVRIGLQVLAMCLDSAVATKGRSELGRGVTLKTTDINPGGLATWPLPNVWLGVSVEDQATADERIPLLLETPAGVRWVSAEPLLGPVDLERVMWRPPRPDHPEHRVGVLRGGYWNRAPYMFGAPSAAISEEKGGFTNHSDMPGTIDWVVVGGESGPKARPMHPAWARGLRDQCAAAGVPFLFKQWGEWRPAQSISEATNYPTLASDRARAGKTKQAKDFPNMSGCYHLDHQVASMIDGLGEYAYLDCAMFKAGRKHAGRLLDGALHDAYPSASGD